GAPLGQRRLHAELVGVAVQIVDVLGDNLAFEILPGAVSDAVAGIDCLRAVRCLAAEIGAPRLAARTRALRERLAVPISPFQAAKVCALARPVAGDEEGHVDCGGGVSPLVASQAPETPPTPPPTPP